jgi:hypothetical protein
MLQVFHLDVAKLDRDIAYICKCFISMFAYVCNDYTRFFKFFLMFCKCFIHMPQVFHLFWTYVASVLSKYCKNRSGVANVKMHVRS